MKKIFYFVLFIIFFCCIPLILPLSVNATDPSVLISEFLPHPNDGGEEWIELLNLNTNSALDLTGYRLVIYQGPEGGYTYFHEQDLSGSIPKGGFLTFATDTGARMPNEGACMVIFRDDTNSVYALKYGTGSCDGGAEEQDASGVAIEQGKSIYYDLDEQT
jgi:hypothetical protein